MVDIFILGVVVIVIIITIVTGNVVIIVIVIVVAVDANVVIGVVVALFVVVIQLNIEDMLGIQKTFGQLSARVITEFLLFFEILSNKIKIPF